MSAQEFSFAHFTDTHVVAGGTPWGLDTTETLRRVIGVLNGLEPRPAFGVIGGDLVSPDIVERSRTLTAEEYEPSYRLLRELLAELAFPVHLLLGNHDHRVAFHRVMASGAPTPDSPHRWAFDHGDYHFVGLDSNLSGMADGEIDPSQLDWLGKDLEANRGRPTFVFVHHHPWPIGIAWLDAMPLRNGEEVTRLLRGFPDVRWMVCGHVHQDQEIQRDGVTQLTTPSTSIQISKVSQARKTVAGPPGFRLFQVRGDSVSTRVLQVPPEGLAAM
jgi:3',5'-cyclic-AMP phosphodiesterase